MHKNFNQELLDIWNKVIRKEPLALARYGDGELLLIKGEEISTDTQAFKQDKWSAPNGLTLLGTDLCNTLHHTEPNYYYGIPCDLSDLQAKKEYLSLISQNFEYITFANLFVNANYPLFKQMLAMLEEEVVLIANKVGYSHELSPLKVKEFIPVDDNCVYFWEKESKNFQKRLDQLAGYSKTLFLISAGPLAKIIIDRLWNKNQTNRYIDVGSAIDEIIYKRITRPYQVAGHENANHVGVLTMDYQAMMRKPLMNNLDMRLRDGVPTIKEYEKAIHSDSFLKMKTFSNHFLEAVADILAPYSQKWVQDPLCQWSRQWEYTFTLLGIQASIANYSSNGQIHILDAGSGVTFFPYYLANIFSSALVTCIDYDPSYASLFASINKRVSHPVAFLNQDMHNINAPDSSFDVIYCISVLEHTEDYETIIQEFKRVLKTDGVLLVSFDISLDGKEGISVETAEKLLQNLRSNFSETEQNGYKTLVNDLRDYDIVTTNRIKSLNPNLLPWKGQHFASLTFSCHLFKKTDELISQRLDESTSNRQNSQQLDEQPRIADFLIPSSYNNGEITVILNGYKRHKNLSRIYDAVSNQTVKPREIMLWYNDFYANQGNGEIAKKCISALTNHNFGVWARFAYALNAKTEYVCIFDDDTIPGKRWFENCLETMKTHEGLLGTIGLIFGSYNYWDHKRYGWANPNKDVIEVDLVGHCWFFKREWLSAFWRDLRPDGFEFVGEDMHFSYTLQKYLGLNTYVPPHPPEDTSLWGSLEGYKLGIDSVAISIINKDDANKKFDAYLKFLLSKEWKLICSKNEVNEPDIIPFAQPLLSIIIPCYNHARFLKEAVESIINQTYENWECIIVNDGSPDNTTDVAKALINSYKDKRIQVLEKPNSGVIDARNLGFSESLGEYILFVDADDKIHPDFLEEAVSILQDRSDVGFVYTDIQYFGVKNHQISHGDFNPSYFLRNNQAPVTSLFRRKIYDQVSGFKKLMEEGLEDWEFWISAYEKGWQGYRIQKPYLYYRQHSTGSRLQNLTSSQLNLEVQQAKIISLHSKLYSNEEVLWSDQVLRKHRSSSATDMSEPNTLPDFEQFLTALFRQIDYYHQDPTNKAVLANIRQARKRIAELSISLSSEELASNYSNALGKAYHSLLNSGVRDEPRTDHEQSFVEQVITHLTGGFDEPKAIHYLLAAMLYCRADQLSLQCDVVSIPQWLFKDYLQYILDSPKLFQKIGEADNYYRYVLRFIDYLHRSIFSNQDSDIWRNVAVQFSQTNFMPMYFTEANLKDIYVKRSEILEWTLKLNGYEVEYEFEETPVTRKKIRLGILAAHFMPAAETFASLPVYEYISREFEVILYSLNQSGHPLEQYCQSCANSFKVLPKELVDQVNLIRADDLDILFIATNVTAVTNEICLLSLHRLARMQVTSVASVVTTGMRHIDYYISGQLTEPLADAEHHYREKLIKLDETAHCFSYGSEKELATVKVERESLGISEETIIFISGANFFKITPELINIWARIIAAVPNSVLILLPFGPNWSNAYPKKGFLNHLNAIFSKHGVAAECLIVLDPQPIPNREDVKEYFKIANVYLDSYPFSGTTSLIEPLEVSLPIVSRQGNTFRSSMGAALLQELEVRDLVADSEESYIKLAIALGTNPELRQQKSDQIKERMQANPRFLDSRSYSAQIGAVLQELFHKHQAQALTENLNLRETNLIVFPDWLQPEDSLGLELQQVIKTLATLPNSSQTTLVVDSGNIPEEEAALILSSVSMNLLMEEDLDVSQGLEISLVGQLSENQWQALLPRIQARIVLEKENQAAIALFKAVNIPSCKLDEYC